MLLNICPNNENLQTTHPERQQCNIYIFAFVSKRTWVEPALIKSTKLINTYKKFTK